MVKVQHLAQLKGDVSSTVVLSDSSKKSKLADDYHAFVQRNSGIVNTFFDDSQYRLTLSEEIDFGESWHVGIFIAHLLFSHSRLATGDVKEGDEIIIASGEIDISTHNVVQINHLAQKCFRASHQLSQLYPNSHLSCFFVPGANYRQPLPDVSMVLTPVDDVTQIIDFFARMGIGEGDVSTLSQQAVISPSAVSPPMISSISDGIEILALKKDSGGIKKAAISILVIALTAALVALFLITPFQRTAMYEKRVGLNACIDTDITVHEFDIAQTTELPAIFMHGLCGVEFSVPATFKSAFVIADEGLFLQLAQTHHNRWLLPVPQDKSHAKKYLIVFTFVELDGADIQSLQQIAENTTDLPMLSASIKTWAATNHAEIHILNHHLR